MNNEKFKVVRCANVINYQCGCLCEYQLIGQFANIKEPHSLERHSQWHIVPCYAHARDITVVERQADKDWEEITSAVKA
jgi:hypothetical protein